MQNNLIQERRQKGSQHHMSPWQHHMISWSIEDGSEKETGLCFSSGRQAWANKWQKNGRTAEIHSSCQCVNVAPWIIDFSCVCGVTLCHQHLSPSHTEGARWWNDFLSFCDTWRPLKWERPFVAAMFSTCAPDFLFPQILNKPDLHKCQDWFAFFTLIYEIWPYFTMTWHMLTISE